MNDCELTAKISAYHDDELPMLDRQAIERHLAGGECDPCAIELRRLRRLSELLAGASPIRMPAEAIRRLYALAPQAMETGFIRLAEWVTGLAAAVLLAGSLWIVTHRASTAPTQAADGQGNAWVKVALGGSADNADAAADLPIYADQVAGDFSSGERP